MERLGWRFHRIWSTDWFRNKNACADKVVAAYEQALHAADKAPESMVRDAAVAAPSATERPAKMAILAQPPARNPSLFPFLVPGQSIDAYSNRDLDRLVRWIKSDDMLRTEEELITEMMPALGFQRRGKNVVARLTAAIRRNK